MRGVFESMSAGSHRFTGYHPTSDSQDQGGRGVLAARLVQFSQSVAGDSFAIDAEPQSHLQNNLNIRPCLGACCWRNRTLINIFGGPRRFQHFSFGGRVKEIWLTRVLRQFVFCRGSDVFSANSNQVSSGLSDPLTPRRDYLMSGLG